MIIPEKFQYILNKDQDINGVVQSTFALFQKWFESNKMEFFPGFTDHGVQHIQAVMRSAEGLVQDAAWELLTPEDIAICVFSILIHDSAMHLSADGFHLLISNSSDWNPRSRFYESEKWPKLWKSFLMEASRFKEKQLIDLFGKPIPVEVPHDDCLCWTDQHRILIGEFIRRYHGIIAHEIALEGVPGPCKERLSLVGAKEWMRDLAGLVARSHTTDIRSCADRLIFGGVKTWRQVHTPFIMGVLRVADYLEIQAPRAPSEILKVRHLHSPLSQQEWKNHEAVVDVSAHESDPESIWVDAEPKDVKTFLALRDLVKGIQQELDSVWAVFGEIYGSDVMLRNLGIRVRRIRSTLDNELQFGKSVPYVPVLAKFKTETAELLKLLVGPLYDEEPSYGIRELVQNSVDACLERDDYIQHFGIVSPDLAELSADVVVTLEEEESGKKWLTVDDRGIGMTPEVILKYYLTAGASFQSSSQWYEFHASGEEPRVFRTGRFGIGCLAAFLLGPEITVTTRHISQERHKGISFTSSLNESEIELKWVERSIGTTLKVQVSEKAFDRLAEDLPLGLKWDWYTGDYPSVVRYAITKRPLPIFSFLSKNYELDDWSISIKLPQCHNLPAAHSDLPSEWRRLNHPDFADVHWTWGGRSLICNNIIIDNPVFNIDADDQSLKLWDPYDSQLRIGVHLRAPSLNIFDNKRKLPINLRRTNLSSQISDILNPQLLQAVCRDFLAFLLVRVPHSLKVCWELLVSSTPGYDQDNDSIKEIGLNYPGIGGLSLQSYHWLSCSRDGVILNEPELLRGLGDFTLYFFPDMNKSSNSFPPRRLIKSMPADHIGVFQGHTGITWIDDKDDQEDYDRKYKNYIHVALHGGQLRDYNASGNDKEADVTMFEAWLPFETEGRALLMTKWFWETFASINLTDVVVKELTEKVVLVYKGRNPSEWLDLNIFKDIKFNKHNFLIFWRINQCAAPLPISPLGELWRDLIGRDFIPLNLKKRRSQLAKAYDELSEEISRWENGGIYSWTSDIIDKYDLNFESLREERVNSE